MLGFVLFVCVLTVVAVLWTIGFIVRAVIWVAVWVVCVWLAVKLERARAPEQRAAWRPPGGAERALSESELLRR